MHKTMLPMALAATFAAGSAQAALCSNDPVPAATLLAPYFEVDSCAVPAGGRSSRLHVYNTGAAPQLAHVTLWTNTALPAFDFDIYLNGYASQEIDLRGLLCDGNLPRTGTGIGQPGRRAAPEVTFAGCNTTNAASSGSPVYGDGSIPAAARAHLQAWFSGRPSPQGGQCGSVAAGGDLMTGYITVDNVDRCNAPVAGEAGFADALERGNTLAGRMLVLWPSQNSSFGYAAVAIEAASGVQLAGQRTFYDFDPSGADAREPLASTYGVDYSRAGTDSATLVMWRGTGQIGTPFACSAKPSWYPLDFSNYTGFSTRSAFAVDDLGHAAILQRSPPLAPLATQRVETAGGFEAGWLQLNFEHSRLPGNAFGGQAWVMRVATTNGRYEREEPGAALDSGCDGPAFDNVSAGPAGPL